MHLMVISEIFVSSGCSSTFRSVPDMLYHLKNDVTICYMISCFLPLFMHMHHFLLFLESYQIKLFWLLCRERRNVLLHASLFVMT